MKKSLWLGVKDQTTGIIEIKTNAHNTWVTLPGSRSENATERRQSFRNAVYNAAISAFGKKRPKSARLLCQRKARSQSDRSATCDHCGMDCRSNIGPFSHNRRCTGNRVPALPYRV